MFGKYLKTESFRKALVHQKRYLLVVLATYEENELKAMAMLHGGHERSKKRKSFRSVAFMVMAIHRMKFIVKRWHTGKRIGAKAILGNQNLPRYALNNIFNYFYFILFFKSDDQHQPQQTHGFEQKILVIHHFLIRIPHQVVIVIRQVVGDI